MLKRAPTEGKYKVSLNLKPVVSSSNDRTPAQRTLIRRELSGSPSDGGGGNLAPMFTNVAVLLRVSTKQKQAGQCGKITKEPIFNITYMTDQCTMNLAHKIIADPLHPLWSECIHLSSDI